VYVYISKSPSQYIDYLNRRRAIIGGMDPYTAERLLLERQRQMAQAAETRAWQRPEAAQLLSPRVWIAGRLRALADRLEGQPQLQRV
jgi:hypothetical protein